VIKLRDLLEGVITPAIDDINNLDVPEGVRLNVKELTLNNKTILDKVEKVFWDRKVEGPLELIKFEIVEVPPQLQGKGIATKLIKAVTGIADKHKVGIYLEVVPIGSKVIPKHKLIEFYKKFGFKLIIYGQRPKMIRMPND
jgi:GNAT superfamily N-acetyltransferase